MRTRRLVYKVSEKWGRKLDHVPSWISYLVSPFLLALGRWLALRMESDLADAVITFFVALAAVMLVSALYSHLVEKYARPAKLQQQPRVYVDLNVLGDVDSFDREEFAFYTREAVSFKCLEPSWFFKIPLISRIIIGRSIGRLVIQDEICHFTIQHVTQPGEVYPWRAWRAGVDKTVQSIKEGVSDVDKLPIYRPKFYCSGNCPTMLWVYLGYKVTESVPSVSIHIVHNDSVVHASVYRSISGGEQRHVKRDIKRRIERVDVHVLVGATNRLVQSRNAIEIDLHNLCENLKEAIRRLHRSIHVGDKVVKAEKQYVDYVFLRRVPTEVVLIPKVVYFILGDDVDPFVGFIVGCVLHDFSLMSWESVDTIVRVMTESVYLTSRDDDASMLELVLN